MPFVTAGDPDLDFTADVLRRMVARGASLCELGIPYSDPIADGLIVGSAIVRRVARAAEKPREQVLAEVGDYVAELLAAMKG